MKIHEYMDDLLNKFNNINGYFLLKITQCLVFLLFFYKNIFKKAIDNIQIHDIIKWYNTDLWAFKENFES